MAEPYACIAVQASTQAKLWNNPHGWREVIAALKERGLATEGQGTFCDYDLAPVDRAVNAEANRIYLLTVKSTEG